MWQVLSCRLCTYFTNSRIHEYSPRKIKIYKISETDENILFLRQYSRWSSVPQTIFTVLYSYIYKKSRLATGRTVRGSNPGGDEIFRSRPHRPWGPPSLLYNGYRVSFPGLKRPGCGASHPIPSSCRGSRTGRAIPLFPLLGPQGLL
jgi:hypothetical protein